MKIKKKLIVEIVLIIMVLFTIVRQFILGSYHDVFLGAFTLVLFAAPKIVQKSFNVSIPGVLETIILVFIFSAEILGEINAFYIKIPLWDTMLHIINGFLTSAIGFALIDICDRNENASTKMSPFFVAFTAFCFAMTVGVIWEFFEFGMDWFFGTDMQKDWVVPAVHSVMLNPQGLNVPVHIAVNSFAVNGEEFNIGGYLDIGLVDTMKDMMVNFIGAAVFSVIGIFYLKNRKETGLAAALIPKVKSVKKNLP